MMFLKTLVVGEEVLLLEPLSLISLEDLQNPMEVVLEELLLVILEAPLGLDLLIVVLEPLLVEPLEELLKVGR